MKTKRILSFLLACLLLAACIPATLASAAGDEPEFVTFFSEDFTDMATLPAASELAGFLPFHAFSNGHTITDGVLRCYNPEASQAFHDFQFWQANFKSFAEIFVISMEFKPIGTWNDGKNAFFQFRRYESGSGTMQNLFYAQNGAILMKADGGDVLSKVLPTDAFSTLEWTFHYNNGLFTAVDFAVEGTKLGTATLTSSELTYINHIRMFYTYSANVGYEVDSFELRTRKDTTQLPQLPAVDPSEQVARHYILHQDFSAPINAGENPNTNAIGVVNAGGFWLKAVTEDQYSLDNGYLTNKGAEFLDLQFFMLPSFTATGSYVVSFRFMPLAADLGGNLLSWRNINGSMEGNRVKLSGGKLVLDNQTVGALPVNDWTLIEIAYNYNTEQGVYDSLTLMVNGTAVGTVELNTKVDVINQFRMFNDFRNKYALDDLNVIEGTSSILYTKAYDPENPVPPTPPKGDLPERPVVDPSEQEYKHYILHNDFSGAINAGELPNKKNDDLTSTQLGVKATGGFWLKAISSDEYDLTGGYLTNKGAEFLDLQFFALPVYTATGSFVLSFEFKPLVLNLSGDLFTWRYYDEGKGKMESNRLKLSGGKLTVDDTAYGTLPLDAWTLIEVVYHFNAQTQLYESFTVILNGEELATAELNNQVGSIDHFRMFRGIAGKYAIDDIKVIEGTKSSLYIRAYDANNLVPPTPPAANVPTLPTVSNADRVDTDYLMYQDFSSEINAGPTPGKLGNDGFWLKVGDDTDYDLKDGALFYKHYDDFFMDLQFFAVSGYDVREDFLLSFNFKPLGIVSCTNLIDFRFNTQTKLIGKKIQLSQNKVIVDGKECGILPADEWTLFEVVFHYNAVEKYFDSFTVMLNGTPVGTGSLTEYADDVNYRLKKIEHFRMFRGMPDNSFMLDDLCAALGTTSMVYAKPYVAPTPEIPNDNNGNSQNAPIYQFELPKPVLKQPTAEAPKEEEKGCKGALSGSWLVMLACMSVAAVQLCKKKK